MIVLLHLSPIAVVFATLFVFRRPPVQAAAAGVAAVALLWLAGAGSPVAARPVEDTLLNTGVLFLSTAFVVAPGLAFVIFIERIGVNKAVAGWVRDLGWSTGQQVVFIVLGLAPLVESMTGFGVSLIATVPLLLSLFPPPIATRIALTGMAIMPWGTLGLATVVGAALAGLDPVTLGQGSALVSAPVFLTLGAIALWLSGTRNLLSWALLLGAWAAFAVVLFVVSGFVGPEFAGVSAGGTVLLLGTLLAHVRGRRPTWPRSAWPYAALLVAILAIKIVVELTGAAEFVVRGADVTWSPLVSPGLALCAVVALIVLRSASAGAASGLPRSWVQRSSKPLLTILLFLLMSQAMAKGGFLDSVGETLEGLNPGLLAPIAAVLAGISGYLTGSNIGGNAIGMPAISILDAPGSTWLAAVQNSGAGHGALGSLPIIALVSGLAELRGEAERKLVRFGLLLVCTSTVLVAASGWLLTYLA